jgi:hypothetical protein
MIMPRRAVMRSVVATPAAPPPVISARARPVTGVFAFGVLPAS